MNSTSPIKAIIADSQKLFRQLLIESIDNKYGITFIDEAENGKKLIDNYFRLMPDIVLVDLHIPVFPGIDAIKEIKKSDSKVKSLFIGMCETDESFYKVLQAGGKGLIGKNCSKEQFIDSMRIINNGGFYYNRLLSESEINDFMKNYKHSQKINKKVSTTGLDKQKIELLTCREKEVFVSFSEGLTREQVSEKLFISVDTLDFHKRNIMSKLGAATFPQLMRYAFEYVYVYSCEENLQLNNVMNY